MLRFQANPERAWRQIERKNVSVRPAEHSLKVPVLRPDGQYFGEVSRWTTLAGVVLAQTRYTTATLVPRHSHECPGFFFIVRGIFEFRNLSHVVTLPSLHAFYYNQQDVHSLRVLSRTAWGFNVEITGSLSSSFSGLPPQLTANTSRVTNFLAQLHRELLRQDPDAVLAVQGIILQLAAELRRERRPSSIHPPSWLKLVEQFLADNLASSLDMEQLEVVAGTEKREIVRAFKEFFHCTPASYLRSRRIGLARRMLINSDKPIIDVAAETGFYDQAHFCHQFRRAIGYSPREFRELMGIKSFHQAN